MIRPIKKYTRIATKFAAQPDPGHFGKHTGIDYAAPVGTPVYAPCDGTVTDVAYGSSGGNRIEINGGGKLRRFLHLEDGSTKVKVGQKVKEGQQIACSGATGNVTGPHLHYDVRKLGTTWDASFANYIDPEKELVIPKTVQIRIKRGTWNVRKGPSTSYAPIGIAKGGQGFTASLQSNGWAKITFNAKTGYISGAGFTKK